MGRRTSPLSEGTILNLAAGAGFGHIAILRALLAFDLFPARVADNARVGALPRSAQWEPFIQLLPG